MRRLLVLLLPLVLFACSAPSPPVARTALKTVGYFTDWGVYGRDFQVKDLDTSGAAGRLTHLVYAFGKVDGGRCAAADTWADYQKTMPAADSVDGVADQPTSPLKGNFGQLRKLKARHPGLRVIWSFGGWNGSGGFTAAARDPQAFAASCKSLVGDARWAGVFDGVDIDWEYPNACGLTCDSSGPSGLDRVLGALRSAFGPRALITAAVPADPGKLGKTDYRAAARSADWLGAMTYDYFGTGADGGGDDESDRHRVEPHAALNAYAGIPRQSANATATIDELLGAGIPPAKILLGIPFYGRGWTGVTADPPGAGATGPADGRYEKGLEDYEILATRCPPTGTVGGTAYARCGSQWWSYDTPQTIKTKMAYARKKSLGGAFAWELSGDTPHSDLLNAVASGLAAQP
ncbi:glycoside hydrolase family 18 protein [Actinoplanes sp. CA-030573]|uniref:glycoside hydrolase family 18 protein n=1 Tax=Actinoplanes sp. CA-030573 TaxID=3239898 RepID=UPI003D8C2111